MPDVTQPRVRVIDDDKAMRQFVALALNDDCAVYEATDAESGLESATAEQPDLVLLDVTLPEESGLDVLIDLRQQLGSVPVIMLTASSDESTEWRLRDLGATAFVAKPVDPDDLRRLVLRYLQPG